MRLVSDSTSPATSLSAVGISPVNWLLLRSRWVSSNRAPNPAGMVPVRLLLGSSTFVTRLGVSPAVTPSHLVMAMSTLQLSAAVPRSVSLAASRAW
jgi:hypothetical protein